MKQKWMLLEMEGIAQKCVMFLFFYLSCVQVISTNLLHGVTRLSDPKEVENVGKVREKDSETPKQETTSEWRKQGLINRLEKDPESFVFTWREKSQMKSASEDDKPFFFWLS